MSYLRSICPAIILLCASPAIAQDDEQTLAPFRSLIETRLAALKSGDIPKYMAMLDKDYVAISDLGERRTRADLPAYLPTISNPARTYAIQSIHVRILDDIVLVDAEIREDIADAVGGWHESDVFLRQGGRWLYLHRQDSSILYPPAPVPTDADPLDDYVGQYRSAGGLTDIITTRDGTLYGQSTPQDTPTALIHVGPGAFAIPGGAGLLVFTRSPTGAVTGLIGHLTSGQISTSAKLP